jgi:hypothetical protein
MTIVELKNILNTSNKSITICFDSKELLLKTEKLLLSNGYMWRNREKGERIFNHLTNCSDVVIFINYLRNEPKILSYATEYSIYFGNDIDISITEETFRLLQLYFNPIPDYKSKKFIREI